MGGGFGVLLQMEPEAGGGRNGGREQRAAFHGGFPAGGDWPGDGMALAAGGEPNGGGAGLAGGCADDVGADTLSTKGGGAGGDDLHRSGTRGQGHGEGGGEKLREKIYTAAGAGGGG